MTEYGLWLYELCKDHGLTFSEFWSLHPADRAFLMYGRAEYNKRLNRNMPR